MAGASRADGSWADVVGEGRLSRFVLICLGVWISAADSMVTATIMPSVGADLGGYAYFGWATAGFLLGSVLCSLSWSAESLIAFRVVQGVGGGIMMPLMMNIIMQAAGGRNLGRISATIGLPAMLGPILGPAIGGVILNGLDWRWIFL